MFFTHGAPYDWDSNSIVAPDFSKYYSNYKSYVDSNGKAVDVDYSDADNDYNNNIPQLYIVAFGDCEAEFNNGVWNLKRGTSGGWYMQPYVGDFAAVVWNPNALYSNDYHNIQGVHAMAYNSTSESFDVPTKTNPNPGAITGQWKFV